MKLKVRCQCHVCRSINPVSRWYVITICKYYIIVWESNTFYQMSIYLTKNKRTQKGLIDLIGRLRKRRKPQRVMWKLLFEHIAINMCVWPSGKSVIRDVGVFRHSDMLWLEDSLIETKSRISFLLKMHLENKKEIKL